jgi:hypothetical protein
VTGRIPLRGSCSKPNTNLQRTLVEIPLTAAARAAVEDGQHAVTQLPEVLDNYTGGAEVGAAVSRGTPHICVEVRQFLASLAHAETVGDCPAPRLGVDRF